MRRFRLLPACAAMLLGLPGAMPRPAPHGPAHVLVRVETERGAIVLDLDLARAPITAGNFLAYVDEHRLDGTSFYRVAPSKRDPRSGFVQGGINHDATRARFAIPHEPTTTTGLHHTDGVVSMARNEPGTAQGDFTIMAGDNRYLDARPGFPGYAAFGHVVSGMDVVRGMLPLPCFPGGYSRETLGQTLRRPVRIVSVRRVR